MLEAHMKTMTPEERAAFLERAAEVAAKVDACAVEVEGEVVEEAGEEAAAEGAAAEACEKPAEACKDADEGQPKNLAPSPCGYGGKRAFLRYFFNSRADVDPEDRFHLNRKTRMRRLREISDILRKHRFLRGFEPEEFRSMLEDLGRAS